MPETKKAMKQRDNPTADQGIKTCNPVLVSPAYNLKLNLMSDIDFLGANHMYDAMIKKLKKEGRDIPNISPQLLKKICTASTQLELSPTTIQKYCREKCSWN